MAALRALVTDAQARGVKVAVFFWSSGVDASQAELLAATRGAVAPVVVDETGSWFAGEPVGRWMNSRIDPHPNAEAHARLAARMLESLRAQHLLPDGFPPAPPPGLRVPARAQPAPPVLRSASPRGALRLPASGRPPLAARRDVRPKAKGPRPGRRPGALHTQRGRDG